MLRNIKEKDKKKNVLIEEDNLKMRKVGRKRRLKNLKGKI